MFTRREEKRGAWGLNMRALGMSVAKKLKKGFEGKSIGGGVGAMVLRYPREWKRLRRFIGNKCVLRRKSEKR